MNLGNASVLRADSRSLPLADDSVDLVVTSPPYFALRSYQDGGEHYAGQIGDEPTPGAFVDSLLKVTRECARVLKPSGSLWVNLGDKYAQDKTLLGLPWRYALRCVDELGLILRAEVVWSKPNGLPESIKDRVRRSHEQWFHFALEPRYFSAVDEIREQYAAPRPGGVANGTSKIANARRSVGVDYGGLRPEQNPLGKLPGSVWTIPTEPLSVPGHLGLEHFAAFPTEWPKRIIQAWCPEGGTILDPFGGTGTSAMVAKALGRHGISVDMSADYCRLAEWRTNDRDQLAKVLGIAKAEQQPDDQLDMLSLL